MAAASSSHKLTSPSKSPEVISGMFNRIAQTYDLLNDCMTGGMHRVWKAQACQALHLEPGAMALDVCTGTGDMANLLSRHVGPKGQVIGIDFSDQMLAIAQKRFSHIDNIQWHQGDALALPFPDNHFDGCLISFGLRNVSSVHQALSEMVRVTKPGGWVVNLDTASDCRNPLFWLYFSWVMPMLGNFLAKDRYAYQYLFQSTKTFESPQGIQSIFQSLGLVNTGIRYFGLGSVALQCGQKPEGL